MKHLPDLDYYQPLADTLIEFFDQVEASLPPLSEKGKWALGAIKEYSLRPSKRVRGSIAAMMYDHAKGTKNDPAGLKLGAAIELIQNHLLIVDDVMDRSTLRRGKPTIHKLYEESFGHSIGREAEMIGMLVGMIVQHTSSLLLLSAEATAEYKQPALGILERSTLITDIGQIDDLDQQLGRKISTEDMLRRYAQKSSYYTFVAPIESALALAHGPSVRDRADAEAFGIPAGVAFQLRDDYLGLFGETSKTGKPNLDDVHEGKYTLIVHRALQKADEKTRAEIKKIIGNPDAGEAELESLRKLLHSTGAVEKTLQDAHTFAEQARKAARGATAWGETEANALDGLITFVMEREH